MNSGNRRLVRTGLALIVGSFSAVALIGQLAIVCNKYNLSNIKAAENQAKKIASIFEKEFEGMKGIDSLSLNKRQSIVLLLRAFPVSDGKLILFDGKDFVIGSSINDIDVKKIINSSRASDSWIPISEKKDQRSILIQQYLLPSSSIQMIHVYEKSKVGPFILLLEEPYYLASFYMFVIAISLIIFVMLWSQYVDKPFLYISESLERSVAAITGSQSNNSTSRKIYGFYSEICNSFEDLIKRFGSFHTKQVILSRGISHEINKPIMLLRHDLKLGINQRISSQDALERADNTAKKTQAIIKNLTMINKLIVQNKLSEKSRINLSEFSKTLIDTLPFDASTHDIKSSCYAFNDNCFVNLDKEMLLQSLYILIENATKYSEPKSKIRISFDLNSKNELEILVIDNGIGIPQSEFKAVFEPFFRGKSNDDSASSPSGSGIGLALVKILVEEELGGQIAVVTPLTQNGTWMQILIPQTP